MGVLCHGRIQVVLNHQHDAGCLLAFCGVIPNGTGLHGVGGAEAMHVNATKCLELFRKFRRKGCMVLYGKIPQGIVQSKVLFLLGQDGLPDRRMRHLRVHGSFGGKVIGNAR